MMMQEEQRNRKEKRRRHPVRAQAKSQNRKTVLRYGGAALHGRLSMAGNNRPFPLFAHLELLHTDDWMSADLIENPSAQKVKKAAGVGGSGRPAGSAGATGKTVQTARTRPCTSAVAASREH